MTAYAPDGLQWGMPVVKNGQLVRSLHWALLDYHHAYLAAVRCLQAPIMLVPGVSALQYDIDDAYGEVKIALPVPNYTTHIVAGLRACHDLLAGGGVVGYTAIPLDVAITETGGVPYGNEQSLYPAGELTGSAFSAEAEAADWDYTADQAAADTPAAGKAPLPVTKAAAPDVVWVRLSCAEGSGNYSNTIYAIMLQPMSQPAMSLEI